MIEVVDHHAFDFHPFVRVALGSKVAAVVVESYLFVGHPIDLVVDCY